MRTFLAMAAGKAIRFLIRLVRRGGGSALPGTIAATIQPNLLNRVIASAPMGLVVVSGSAGKSSTTKMLVELLRAHGKEVFTNPSTANIKQGLYAAILQFADFRGRIDADVVVLEWDEGHGAALASRLRPKVAVLTNVFSDQLDRFIDPEVVADKLRQIHDSSENVVINIDDKNLTQFAEPSRSIGFSGASSGLEPLEYALNFGPSPKLQAFVELLEADGKAVRIRVGDELLKVACERPTAHQAMNMAAAVAALSQLLSPDWRLVERVLSSMPPVFARDEIAQIRGRRVRLMLVQNPTSFRLNLSAITGNETPLMLMAGGDIHDPSWLWTVDFSKLSRVDVVGGRNAHELALRLRYQGVQIGAIYPEASDAAEAFLAIPGESPTLLFSADAMRRTRRYLGLAK